MSKNKRSKIISIIVILITLVVNINSFVQANVDITTADLKYVKDCGDYLQAKDGNSWYTIVASYVEYQAPNGQKYPAYCLDNTIPGVGNPSIGDLPEGYTVNISKLLDNDKVYRAVINGYPYKTPAELNVQDKYDAYIATKQAVYSVLYNYNVEERYRGTNQRGENIKKAIKNIVQIARNGTTTQKTPLIQFEKVGGLVEDSVNPLYYSQTYQINSDVSLKSYTIIKTEGFADNTIITDMNNQEINTFEGNQKFKVLIPKEKLGNEKDIEGKIYASMKCKTYPIFYGSKSSKLQPYALTYDTYGDNTANTTLQAKMNTGKIQIYKIDENTKEPIEGVKFKLTKIDGTEVAEATTNQYGIATFSDLYEGKYLLQETETRENYTINATPFEIDVVYNKTTDVEITNQKKPEEKKPEKEKPEEKKPEPKKLPRTGF